MTTRRLLLAFLGGVLGSMGTEMYHMHHDLEQAKHQADEDAHEYQQEIDRLNASYSFLSGRLTMCEALPKCLDPLPKE